MLHLAILALDCGTHTGWAFGDGSRIESGVQVFDLKRGESPGMRYIRFNAWLQEIFDLLEPDLVAFEMAHHRGGAATELMAGMTTRILEACADRGINHTSVHSATLKKFATGSGRADKEAMKKRASKIAGRLIISDDEADALCLLEYIRGQFGDKK